MNIRNCMGIMSKNLTGFAKEEYKERDKEHFNPYFSKHYLLSKTSKKYVFNIAEVSPYDTRKIINKTCKHVHMNGLTTL